MRIQGATEWARRLLMGSLWLAVSIGCEAGGSLTITPTSVMFSATEGQETPVRSQGLTGKVETSSNRIFLGAVHTQNGLEQAAYSLSNPIAIELAPKPPATLGAGTYTDTVVILACEDEECEHPFEGSPAKVSVTYDIKPALFAITHDDKSFHHTLGEPGVIRSSVIVTTLSNRVAPWTVSATQDWLRFNPSRGQTSKIVDRPNSVDVVVDPQGLEPGRHTGEFFFTDTATGVTSQRIPITLDIELPTVRVSCRNHSPDCPGLSFGGPSGTSPQQLWFSPGGLSRTSRVYPWTASVDLGDGPSWLNLSATSGTVAGAFESVELTASVDPAGLSAGTHTGTLTVNLMVDGHTVSKTLPVSLTVNPP